METDDDLLVLLEKAEQEKKPEYERLDRKDDPFDPLKRRGAGWIQ